MTVNRSFPAFVCAPSFSVYLWLLCGNSLLFLLHRSCSMSAHLPVFLLCTFLSAPSSTTLCLYLWLMAECVLALAALTRPDKRRSASICQPLHLWAAQSRGELASLFVLSPSWDSPAAKGSLQVYRSSTLSQTHWQIPAHRHIHKHYAVLPLIFCACLPSPFHTCNLMWWQFHIGNP